MLKLEHERTKEVMEIDDSAGARSKYRFLRLARGVERTIQEKGLGSYFMTLTVEDNYLWIMNKDLNRFLTRLRGAFKKMGLVVVYAWVVGVQRERYAKYGVAAPHWHLMIGVEVGKMLDHADLAKMWGRGFVWIQEWKGQGLANYLGRYMNDEEDMACYNPAWIGERRFGSSRLGWRAYPAWAYEEIMESGLGDLLVWKKGKGKVAGYGRTFDDFSGISMEKKVIEYRSPWRLMVTQG